MLYIETPDVEKFSIFEMSIGRAAVHTDPSCTEMLFIEIPCMREREMLNMEREMLNY